MLHKVRKVAEILWPCQRIFEIHKGPILAKRLSIIFSTWAHLHGVRESSGSLWVWTAGLEIWFSEATPRSQILLTWGWHHTSCCHAIVTDTRQSSYFRLQSHTTLSILASALPWHSKPAHRPTDSNNYVWTRSREINSLNVMNIRNFQYTGCITTLGHNCRRWFPRSLWSKKFI
jgi:hypothetical protein